MPAADDATIRIWGKNHMAFTIQEIAEAFSRHDFEVTYPHMVDDIRWNMVGGGEIVGKKSVISVCDESAEELKMSKRR